MQNYDSIKGFEYWDIDAWKNFIKENILSLHNSVSKLLRLRDFMLTIIGAVSAFIIICRLMFIGF